MIISMVSSTAVTCDDLVPKAKASGVRHAERMSLLELGAAIRLAGQSRAGHSLHARLASAEQQTLARSRA